MAPNSQIFFLASFFACALFTGATGAGSNCKKSDDCGSTVMKCGSNGVCKCISGYFVENSTCKYRYQTACKNNSTCGSPTMFCSKNKCECLPSTHAFKDGACKASIGGLCVGDDCLSESAVCSGDNSSKTCQCEEGYKQNGEKCQASPGKICTTISGCIDKHSTCSEVEGTFKCICQEDYKYNNETKTCSGSTITGSIIAAAFALLLRSV